MDNSISGLFTSATKALSSTSKVLIKDAKNDVISELSSALKGIALKLIAVTICAIAGIYLFFFGFSLLLNYFDVPSLYHYPIYAFSCLIGGGIYLAFSNVQNSSEKKAERAENLRRIADFNYRINNIKHDVNNFMEHPVKNISSMSQESMYLEKLKQFYRKNNLVVLGVLVTVAFILAKTLFPRSRGSNSRKRARTLGLTGESKRSKKLKDSSSTLVDSIKGIILTALTPLITKAVTDLVTDLGSKANSKIRKGSDSKNQSSQTKPQSEAPQADPSDTYSFH